MNLTLGKRIRVVPVVDGASRVDASDTYTVTDVRADKSVRLASANNPAIALDIYPVMRDNAGRPTGPEEKLS